MIVILDNIRSAQNVGSVIRTCEAFGIKELYLCGITPGPDNKKVLKTSLGAEKNVLVQNFTNIKNAIVQLKKGGYKIISLEITKDAKDISDIKPMVSKFALVLGNEVSGVSEWALAQSDKTIKIPMQGKKESLNVAVAFGIAAYCLTGKK